MNEIAGYGEICMREAVRLARKGIGRTSPNPMVGAVVSKDGRIIGRGYHKKYGGKHAEVNAIEDAGGEIKGATVFVTLEPCSHYGKTPPCTDAIIQAKAARVVIGTPDPNPQVAGNGGEILRDHGIEVEMGVLERECRELNEVYFKYVCTGVPFITLKYAQTLDGRIATQAGQSQWISGQPFLKYVHRLRSVNDGLAVGVGTVIADDPSLTVRLVKGKNPLRIVIDSRLRLPLEAKVLTDSFSSNTLVVTTSQAESRKIDAIAQLGAEVVIVDADQHGRVDLSNMLIELGRRQITSVMVEGGSEIATSLLRDHLADRMVMCLAPRILGKGTEAIGDLGISNLSNAIRFSSAGMRTMGDDFVIEGRLLFV